MRTLTKEARDALSPLEVIDVLRREMSAFSRT
jgi:hypothetical protein